MSKDLTERQKNQLRQLGLMVAYYRGLKELSQEEVAFRAGISRTHLSNLEAPGKTTSVSLPCLFAIADALEVPVKDLFDFRAALPDRPDQK